MNGLSRWLVALSLLCFGCQSDSKPKKRRAGTGRVAAVQKTVSTAPVNDPAGFCEKTFPASGLGAVRFKWPPLRPLPGASTAPVPKTDGQWTWVNLWATWCKPCMEEMGLLGRWTKALKSVGQGLRLSLLTIDETSAGHALANTIDKGLPGPVSWLRSKADFVPFLDRLSLDPGAAIPIHVLVDPKGQLRCVRVGAIHAVDFAAVKRIISGG